MSDGPGVVVGAPLYNNALHLPEAIESFLLQRRRDFALILLDDASEDATAEVCRRYAARDDRLVVVRNPRRLGYLLNARRAFEEARRRFPHAPYFAWGSDHDIWHPRWMQELVDVLDRHPAAVLAYPMNLRIDEEGLTLPVPLWSFDTAGVTDRAERFSRACGGMSAGNMVYGLYRVSALEQTGLLREVLLPDRLLIAELALVGEFHQVPEILWYRRYVDRSSLDRQVRSLFPRQRPWHLWIPWWITHTRILAREGSDIAWRHFHIRLRQVAGRRLRRVREKLGAARAGLLARARSAAARVGMEARGL